MKIIIAAILFVATATAFVQPASAYSCTTQYVGSMAYTNCF
jgi:hypothetical protein